MHLIKFKNLLNFRETLTSSRNRNKTADKLNDLVNTESIVRMSYDNPQYNILNNSGQQNNNKKTGVFLNVFKNPAPLPKNNYMSKNFN